MDVGLLGSGTDAIRRQRFATVVCQKSEQPFHGFAVVGSLVIRSQNIRDTDLCIAKPSDRRGSDNGAARGLDFSRFDLQLSACCECSEVRLP